MMSEFDEHYYHNDGPASVYLPEGGFVYIKKTGGNEPLSIRYPPHSEKIDGSIIRVLQLPGEFVRLKYETNFWMKLFYKLRLRKEPGTWRAITHEGEK